jgi:hypothetical protein
VKSVVQNQLDDIKNLTGINSLILSVCLVDTLAGFYCGYNGQKNGNKVRYLKFVEKYLNPHKDYLYEIRCNLTHSFSNTVSNFLFVDNKEFTSVFKETTQILDNPVFNIDKFKEDLTNAINFYFKELANAPSAEILNNFNLRFDSLKILTDSSIPTIRNLKGEIVKNFENLDSLPGLDLKIAIASPTKVKK